MFAAAYVYYWSRHFKDAPLRRPPCFDARVVAYPTEQNVRDYFSWRQVWLHFAGSFVDLL
jgi:tRNA(His) guanylyltransferase